MVYFTTTLERVLGVHGIKTLMAMYRVLTPENWVRLLVIPRSQGFCRTRATRGTIPEPPRRSADLAEGRNGSSPGRCDRTSSFAFQRDQPRSERFSAIRLASSTAERLCHIQVTVVRLHRWARSADAKKWVPSTPNRKTEGSNPSSGTHAGEAQWKSILPVSSWFTAPHGRWRAAVPNRPRNPGQVHP